MLCSKGIFLYKVSQFPDSFLLERLLREIYLFSFKQIQVKIPVALVKFSGRNTPVHLGAVKMKCINVIKKKKLSY